MRKPEIAPVFDALQGHYALVSPDNDFEVVAISDKLLAMMDGKRDAVIGQPVLTLFTAGHDVRAMRISLEKVLNHHEADSLPAMRLDLGGAGGHGAAHHWTFCNTPVFDQPGQLGGILLHAENVSRLLHAEQGREADEALNRQILDSARDFAIIGTDLEGRVTFWNEGASRVLGWSEAEMLGQESARIFTPEDLAEAQPALDRQTALEHGYASDERWHVRRDGRRIWACGQLTPLKSAAGAAIGFVRMLRDQTEQHLTAQALRESRHRLDSALDTGLVGFFEWDVVDGLVVGDERFAAMFGMAPAQARQGLPLPDLISRVHADDRQALRHCLDTALATHADTTRELRVVAEDGRVGWVLLRARRYLQHGDKPLRYTGAAIDVSASKLAEAQVRKLNARLAALVMERTSALHVREAQMRAIFESSHQFQCLLSADGVVLDANPVSLAAIGAQLQDVAGQPFHDTPWLARSGAAREVMRTSVVMAAAGQAMRHELTLDLAEGKRHFDFAIRPVHGRDRTVIGIVAEATDITGRRRAEEQLRQSQKMEAIGQLTGGIAHDFNNLLAGIMGSLELMRHKFNAGQTQDHARYIDMATSSAQRAATLTQRLLAFSRRQTLDLKPVDVNELVAGMADLLHRTLNRNIELTFRLAPDLAHAWTDANQLENALLNLAINARDAMNEGGKLTIGTANLTLDRADSSSRPELEPGAYLMLSVSDTGSGMTPDVIAKAFDPFFTTKPMGQGTGLGLSMIYGYVKQSRGNVTIHSRLGQGSTITLYLPCHRTDEPAMHEEPPVPVLPAGSGQRILLVEDEAAMRAILVETLNGLGYRTIQAGDAAAALAAIDAGEAPDLLITDVGLPGLNGRQLADQVRLRRPGTRVLFITGYAGPLARADLVDDGMDMIGKPFALDALAVKVRDMLAK